MTIHTFGDYCRWHPHVHGIVADGLFYGNGMKSFQLVRYYGFYSNRSRGERRKEAERETDHDSTATPEEVEVIDVSSYKPPRLPSKTWRECTPRAFASRHIKKVWEVDPLECPKCHAEMKIISFISKSQPEVIRKILEHLGLWEEKIRPPPSNSIPPHKTFTYEPFDDSRPGYEEPFITVD